jgi:thymidine kinase
MGKIEIITGPMFSGKTSSLIRMIIRFKLSKRGYVLFKPKMDDRYSNDEVVSHDQNSLSAVCIETSADILKFCEENQEIKNIGIDEIQFLNKDNPERMITDLIKLRNSGYHIIASGLDMDAMGSPFRFIPNLLAIADQVYKQKAVCFDCGEDAGFSHRTVKSTEQVQLGSQDKYKALCLDCWLKSQS